MMIQAKILLALSLLVGTSGVLARPPGPSLVEERLKRLEEQLKLTPEQKPKVEAILRKQQEKTQAMRAQTHERLKEVLTKEQAVKLERLREEQRERRRNLLQRFSRD